MAGLIAVCAGQLVGSRTPNELERVLASGELHMVSRNGPTTFYEGPQGLTGFEYVLAKKFADRLGVDLVVHAEDDLGMMFDSIQNKDFHFAAAGLTITEKRKNKVRFADPYLEVTQTLIYNTGAKRPKSIEDVIGSKIAVIGNSSHSERLRFMQREYPALVWQEYNNVEMLDLLEMVHNGEIDYTIVDSNAYDYNKSLYPRAKSAFDVSEGEQLAWAFPPGNDDSLFMEVQRFFRDIKQIGVIEDTVERFYGHLGELDYSGALVFSRRIDTRLPKWQDKLKKTGEKYDLDWSLLAAISYQESHWNPSAKSPTGVRGFMMLTLNTAKELKVTNRLSADQSIDGGARYFKKMLNRMPERIQEPERTWLALAAYNIGYGHLEDARILTQHRGGNPDKWVDVKEDILKLAKSKYYKFTKHGYARGWEAVDYVQNIRNFHTIIAWNEKQEQGHLAKNNVTKNTFAQFSPDMTEALKSIAVYSL
ncbi:MAG: membrane-bound lytic murein transglycosylase MltF [Alteromonadaceae bacterium]|nr:MAG: membrane-bound lytic murein transglycosylase MltF [Alteromonadaceae bacterium]